MFYNINDFFMKTLFYYVKDNEPHHKTLSCPIFSCNVCIIIYGYMCVDMCIMNVYVHDCLYVFSCFPCYLGLIMTASFCWYPLLRFNKACQLYLKFLPLWGLCTVIRLHYRTIYWLGLCIDIYIYTYTYIDERNNLVI